jgi:hypothetical protein
MSPYRKLSLYTSRSHSIPANILYKVSQGDFIKFIILNPHKLKNVNNYIVKKQVYVKIDDRQYINVVFQIPIRSNSSSNIDPNTEQKSLQIKRSDLTKFTVS